MNIDEMSWRFRDRAAECWQLAENARFEETKAMLQKLAVDYENLADRLETNGSLGQTAPSDGTSADEGPGLS